MHHHSNRRIRLLQTAAAFVTSACLFAPLGAAPAVAASDSCAGDNGGLSLSPGFCATVFADKIGHARHIAVARDGTVYINTWSGRYYKDDKPPAGGMAVVLRDRDGDGKADFVRRVGGKFEKGAAGGTGVALFRGGLFVEEADRIDRYGLGGDGLPRGGPQTVLSGMPLGGDHPMHPFVIDASGNIFVDMGSATNACQEKNRMPMQPGLQPCKELETRGGVWRYDANKLDQKFSPAERYATGIRNGEGFALDAQGRLYDTQHGRDQLTENWPQLYKPAQGAALPAEEIFQVTQGADFGWPECYFDGEQKKLVLAPEYGGDGGKKTGVCDRKGGPAAYFPAHWAPNDLMTTDSAKVPAPYRGGLFVAFHGSWNRAPSPQGGFNVVYQPMANGKASGDFVVFADGFAGKIKEPGRAAHRPSGLAVGPDGALYIADDVGGRVWRLSAKAGSEPKSVEAAPAVTTQPARSADATPPEGTHPDSGRKEASLPVPSGATADQVALGDRIFHGEAKDGTCGGCHGSDAKGGPVGPDLTTGKWEWSDGSLNGITQTITAGVPAPKNFQGAMPPMGGAQLSEADVKAVAAYVWAVGHSKRAEVH